MRPVLIAVHTEPSGLNDIEVRDRYATGYRVRCTSSPHEALEILARLSDREKRWPSATPYARVFTKWP
jgi:hypothetical protein